MRPINIQYSIFFYVLVLESGSCDFGLSPRTYHVDSLAECVTKCRSDDCIGFEIYPNQNEYWCKTYGTSATTKASLMTTNSASATCYLRRGKTI